MKHGEQLHIDESFEIGLVMFGDFDRTHESYSFLFSQKSSSNFKLFNDLSCPYHVVFNCFLTFQADPGNTGSLGALDAANFMKKSGLNDKALSQVMIIITRLQTHVLTLLELTTKSEGKD